MAAQATPQEIAAGLRQLADMIEANPDIRVAYLDGVNVWCPSNREEIQAIIRAGKAAGGEIVKDWHGDMANVVVRFGAVGAKALMYRSEVCERVVVGTETVQVPDPAFMPSETPMIDQVRDVVEWRCRPLLAPEDPSVAGLPVAETDKEARW